MFSHGWSAHWIQWMSRLSLRAAKRPGTVASALRNADIWKQLAARACEFLPSSYWMSTLLKACQREEHFVA